MKKVLFVCTGNTCRSPMAEAIFNFLTRENSKICAKSCGIYGDGVSKISSNAKAVLLELGIDFEHTSAPITEKLVEDADYIIGMTSNHAKRIVEMFPQHSNKIFSMPADINDPYGGSIDVYRNCRNELTECIRELLKAVFGESDG